MIHIEQINVQNMRSIKKLIFNQNFFTNTTVLLIRADCENVPLFLVELLSLWRRNYFFNFSTHCILNVNNTGTKQVRIMKQTEF